TKGGQFALHSQSIQMVCHQFLANVKTTRQLKNPQCRFVGHRDIVGSLNMHQLAFGHTVAYPSRITYLRPSRDVVAAGAPACGRGNPY
ncbi:MAG TPA: hypothetical protein VFN02_02240, partial [Ktedonobacteraceae bacterium]|nr:hypothetical protein [Ktedonobacteraceae bacterium]